MTPSPKNEKRKYLRHPFGLPIRLAVPKDGEDSITASQDISQGGLCFLWKAPLSRGRAIHITIPVKEKRFELDARVTWSHRDSKMPGFYRTGVQFTDPSSAFKAKLAEETLEILAYQKRVSRDLGHEVSVEEAAQEWIGKYAAGFTSDNPAF